SHLILAGVLKRVIFQIQPDPAVKGLNLWNRVGDVHGIAVAKISVVAPGWVLAPGHMTPAVLWRIAVTFLHDLGRFRDARIKLPAGATGPRRLLAIDIAGAEAAHAPADAHDHGEVVVAQLLLGSAVEGELQNVVLIVGEDGERDFDSVDQKVLF